MKYAVIVMILVVFLVAAEMIRELRTFRVTHYDAAPQGGNETGKKHRIVFLSDLHNRIYGKENSRLLEAVRRENPELILIGGDMLVGKNGCDFAPAIHVVSALADICPVYYANGNHEQRMKERPEEYELSYEQYKNELVDAGVCFLENRSEEVKLGNMKLRVTGVEIPAACYSHFHRRGLKNRELVQRIGTCPGRCCEILLAHNPSYMKEYLAWGADLVMSGHFHGGIVRLPGIGGVISPGFHIFPKYSGGIYREENGTAVVSKGLGSHTIPFRLFNPAEVVVLDLRET